MSDKLKKLPRKDAAVRSAQNMVDELYRLAEIIQTASDEDCSESQERRHMAAVRMAELMQPDRDRRGAEFSSQANHEWVLDVLEDLAQYAAYQNLVNLNRLLVDARFVAGQMLEDERGH